MGLSIWQLAVVAILVILLFGRGKLSGLMTDLAEGIKSFREGIKDSPAEQEPKRVTEADVASAGTSSTHVASGVDR